MFEKTLNFAQTDNLDIVAVLISYCFKMDSSDRKFGFNFTSIMLKKVSILLHVCRNNEIGVKPAIPGMKPVARNETGQPE